MNFQKMVSSSDNLFSQQSVPVLTPADRYRDRTLYEEIFGVPKFWPSDKWVHLVHNWRTGGSSLTALLSSNFHDSYLKIGHPFTRDGWPVNYELHPLQITRADQLQQWVISQPSPGILAGHTYSGMPLALGLREYDSWLTLRDPAARLNSGLLRFHRKPLKNDHPEGGYVTKTGGHNFSSAREVEEVANTHLSHELNGMCRRIAGYHVLSQSITVPQDLESCPEVDERPVDQSTFDLAVDKLRSSKWLYLTDQVLPSILLLESSYSLNPLIHPCSDLVHNPQWNGSGITRVQQSLLTKYRPLLENLNSWDVKLYSEAVKIFWQRWNQYGISTDKLIARRILQEKPLVDIRMVHNSEPSKAILDKFVAKVHFRANKQQSNAVKGFIINDGLSANFLASPLL